MAAICKDDALFGLVGLALNERISMRRLKLGVIVDIATAALFGAVICWYAPTWDLTAHSWYAYALVTGVSGLCATAGFRAPMRALNWSMERSEREVCTQFRFLFRAACNKLGYYTDRELRAAPPGIRNECAEVMLCARRSLELLHESRSGIFSPLPKSPLDVDVMQTLVDRIRLAGEHLELG